MEKPKFIPIQEASTNRVNLHGIVFPPFVEKNRIGINARRIERLMDIGGIKTLAVKTVTGETSNEMPTVVGMTEKGEALAGKKAVKTIVPVFDSRSSNSDADVPMAFRWADANIVINMDEVSQRLEQQKKWQNGVQSVPGWAYYVDKAITEGVSKTGNNNLTKPGGWKWKSFYDMYMTILYAFGGLNFLSDLSLHSGFESIAICVGSVIPPQLFNEIAYRWQDRSRSSHPSLSLGSQYDRALVLKAASKMTKVAKEIPLEKS